MEQMSKEFRLAELLCTRLCHDLIGPVGAVNNGAEFLREEEGNLQGQVIDLIESSAKDAVARLQFYRQAYGKVNDSGEAGLDELKKLTQQFFNNTKITLEWPDIFTDASGVPVSRRMGKLLVNLIIIASGALIRGGTLAVRIERCESGEECLAVTVDGKSARLDEETLEALSGKMNIQRVSPKSIQPYLAAGMAKSLGVTPDVRASEDHVEIVMVRAQDPGE